MQSVFSSIRPGHLHGRGQPGSANDGRACCHLPLALIALLRFAFEHIDVPVEQRFLLFVARRSALNLLQQTVLYVPAS